MGSARQVVVDVLLAGGVGLTVLSSLAALRSRSVFRRLHYLTVVTSLAAPLVGLAAVVADGVGLTAATVVLIVVLLACTGPVLSAVTGRRNAQRDHVIEVESPE
jgi:multicomponent Na+:H+ antiporter subunit G